MLMGEDKYIRQIRMMANQIDIRDWEISILKEGMKVLSSNEGWICGEYQDKSSDYYGKTEKEIAILVLEKLADR